MCIRDSINAEYMGIHLISIRHMTQFPQLSEFDRKIWEDSQQQKEGGVYRGDHQTNPEHEQEARVGAWEVVEEGEDFYSRHAVNEPSGGEEDKDESGEELDEMEKKIGVILSTTNPEDKKDVIDKWLEDDDENVNLRSKLKTKHEKLRLLIENNLDDTVVAKKTNAMRKEEIREGDAATKKETGDVVFKKRKLGPKKTADLGGDDD
eukprot:TRINITY_DN3893_c0_g1_i2.p1 TRINITY_DN3893_c0_g1~~TRINITY_DN3893_c0_g1_i2.p1  ORF type:complete len:226 (-),score=59.67 TRINITY_DN3893_c0_g1_i2:143-760(-)